jgi:hypothetical protein
MWCNGGILSTFRSDERKGIGQLSDCLLLKNGSAPWLRVQIAATVANKQSRTSMRWFAMAYRSISQIVCNIQECHLIRTNRYDRSRRSVRYRYVHSRKQKLAAFHSNSPPGSTVIRILRFFVALYLLFLPSHRYRTKQNRSCQLLLNVRM